MIVVLATPSALPGISPSRGEIDSWHGRRPVRCVEIEAALRLGS